jgi:hypothetical protein
MYICYARFGVSQVGISQCAMTRGLHLSFSGAETSKLMYIRYARFGVSQVGILRCAMTRGHASEFPESRNFETRYIYILYIYIYIYIYIIYMLSSFRGFASRDFGTGEYKRLSLRYPEYRNTVSHLCYYHFGVS